MSLAGLPARLTADLGRKTVSFSGYRPRDRKLVVYLASEILAPVPIKAMATLDGLPETVTGMSVGPFGVGSGGVVNAAYRVEPAATLTSLEVLGEATTPQGTVRGRLVVDPVPASVAVSGAYGGRTHIAVRNSAPIDTLIAKVTVVPRKGKTGTGAVRFTDVPATFSIDATASGRGLRGLGGFRVPRLAYKADADTLDGTFAIESSLVPGLLGSSFVVTDLASDTTVRVNPDLSVDLASRPVPTKLMEIHAGLSVGSVQATASPVPYGYSVHDGVLRLPDGRALRVAPQ